ncbi:translation protein [Violaceomyces palustris]|uniref:Translation protein n=1 Tax=Violaceomyces palustris TaxID=1673888 RepID=A0ACD0P5M8_9BASI|nr:translation protein [Violaceomyces palustris]
MTTMVARHVVGPRTMTASSLINQVNNLNLGTTLARPCLAMVSSPSTSANQRMTWIRTRSMSTTSVSSLSQQPPSQAQVQDAKVKVVEETVGWNPTSRRTGLIARKKGMTSYFTPEGQRIPATVLQIDSNQVSALIGFASEVKENDKEKQRRKKNNKGKGQVSEAVVKGQGEEGEEGVGEANKYYAIQISATDSKNVSQQIKGHLKKAGIQSGKKVIREFRVTKDAMVPLGTTLSAAHFVPGQSVDVRAITRGKGFQGAMKRHGFHGLRASHGVSISHRSHGSTGQCQDPGRVWPGKKMAGRMGGNKHGTIHNLKVLRIDLENELVLVKGNVPGPAGGVVEVRDATRNLIGKAAHAFKSGKLPGGLLIDPTKGVSQYLPEGIENLPFPAGTKELADSLPEVIEAGLEA